MFGRWGVLGRIKRVIKLHVGLKTETEINKRFCWFCLGFVIFNIILLISFGFCFCSQMQASQITVVCMFRARKCRRGGYETRNLRAKIWDNTVLEAHEPVWARGSSRGLSNHPALKLQSCKLQTNSWWALSDMTWCSMLETTLRSLVAPQGGRRIYLYISMYR